MKILVLGATGPTGQCLVTQALDAGHEVTAVVRTPSKMTIIHDKLKVVKGNIFSASSLQGLMAGHDAVVTCLGYSGPKYDRIWFKEVTIYTDFIEPVITAMKAAKVKRLVVLSSWGTTDERGPFLMDWLVRPLFLKNILKNTGAMEKYMEQECPDDISYTSVKPPILGGPEVTDKEIQTEVGRQSIPGTGYSTISRGDLARFMLGCLDDNEDGKWTNKMVAIGY